MIEYLGKWKFSKAMIKDENDNFKYVDANEYLNSPILEDDEEVIEHEKQERERTISSIMDVCEDGFVYYEIPAPEGVSQEEIDMLVKKGRISIKDGLIVLQKFSWKIEDGVFLTDFTGRFIKSEMEDKYLFFILYLYEKVM